MKSIRDLYKGSLLTRGRIETMQLGANGWNAGHMCPENLVGPLVYLYLWDDLTSWAWVCSIQQSAFDKVAKEAIKDKPRWQDIRNGLSAVIAMVTRPGAVLDEDTANTLALLATSYAATTSTFELADHLKRGGHFFILNYRVAGTTSGLLRPVARPAGEPGVIPAAEYLGMIDTVHAMDMENHPEWFA